MKLSSMFEKIGTKLSSIMQAFAGSAEDRELRRKQREMIKDIANGGQSKPSGQSGADMIKENLLLLGD